MAQKKTGLWGRLFRGHSRSSSLPKARTIPAKPGRPKADRRWPRHGFALVKQGLWEMDTFFPMGGSRVSFPTATEVSTLVEEAELPQKAAPEAPRPELGTKAPLAEEPVAQEGGTEQLPTVEEPNAVEETLTTAEVELPQEAAPEAPLAEEPPAEEEGTDQELTEVELNALYSGEVELVLTPPINAAVVSRLHNELLSNPELRIVRTEGSWEKGTIITVFLDKPLPLLGLLAEIPELRLSTWVKAEGRGGASGEKRLDHIGITMASGVAAGEATPAVAVKGGVEAEVSPEAPRAAGPAAEEGDTAHELSEAELNALYSGEVELEVAPQISAAAMSLLYNHLLNTAELRVVGTWGSWEGGTTISVFLDKPQPLIGLLAEIPELRPSARVKVGGKNGASAEKSLACIGITAGNGVAALEAAPAV